MPQNPMFNPGRRDADSEWKILEDLVNQLNLHPNSSGRIHIYSERPVCPSCQGVIRQFRAAFPGIELTYSHLGR